MRIFLACLLGLLLSMPAGRAAPPDPAQRDAALAVFHAWNKAIAAGRLDEAVALRSAAMRAQIAPDIATAAQRTQVLEFLKAMLPDTVDVERATQSKDGKKLTLHTVVGATVPKGAASPGAPPAGTRTRAELTLQFVREGGKWMFDNQTFGMDPDKIKPCANTAFEGMDAFEMRDNLTMGGQIRRIEFAADHTMLVIRMLDEENCIFLPSRARLTELGFDPDWLRNWAIVELAAWPHRADKQRFWAANLKVQDEEE